jgi:putative hydrolase of the HAD superfamily
MKRVVLFDLGGTLARYYQRDEFPAILEEAIGEAGACLRREAMWLVVREEDHEVADGRVRPLEGRLARIFGLDEVQGAGDVLLEACRCFMRPIFARGRRYEDALPVLQSLRAGGFRTAVVSNTPWGSPAGLWREEIERLGLGEWLDATVFCRDAGWRKPARPIFDYTLERVGATPQDCLFVGDDPRWDLVGPRGAGIEAVLIDRHGTAADGEEEPIRTLHELWTRLGSSPMRR